MADQIIILIGLGIALAVFFLALFMIQSRLHSRRYVSYRSRYLQMIAQLDVITVMASQLASFLKEIQQNKLLDEFETSLASFESILQAFKLIPAFGDKIEQLGSAQILVKQCYDRFALLQLAFRDDLGGRTMSNSTLKTFDFSKSIKGCYFCSRPSIEQWLQKVRVKLDSATRDVLSCRVCKEELVHTKKVKVLYFVREGRPVHWADVKEYRPSEDYWHINHKNTIRKERHLELV